MYRSRKSRQLFSVHSIGENRQTDPFYQAPRTGNYLVENGRSCHFRPLTGTQYFFDRYVPAANIDITFGISLEQVLNP